ncbi:MAG: DNA methyltransferase [Polaribacter sp.]
MKSKTDFFLAENTEAQQYAPDYTELEYSEKELLQKQKSFNGLSAKEWTVLSKNVWNDLSSPRNKYQLEHGAVYPIKLAERLIQMYSREGDIIFDPFLGIGSTLIAAQNLNRHCIGTELNPKFAKIAEEWKQENFGLFNSNGELNYSIVNDDCRNLTKYIAKDKVQLTVTSPPYADFIQKSVEDRKKTHKTSIIKLDNNSTVKQYSEKENDFGNLPYEDFLTQIKEILEKNYEITKTGGYSAWVVKDYRDTKNKIPYIPFHSDLAKVGQDAGWKFQDLIVWDQGDQRRLVLLGYPSVFYTNQNCSFIVIFRKL